MIRRQPIGYVVEIDGSALLVNLHEDARGHVAGHPDGVSTVGQPGDLAGVQGGSDIIVLRILSIAFAEPKEMHAPIRGRGVRVVPEPLRQLRGQVIGFLRRGRSGLGFIAQDWRLPVLGAAVFPLSDTELLATIGDQGPADHQINLGSEARNPLVSVRANVNDLLARHFAILGATGQGKTHFLAAILQSLLPSPRSRIVIFDVNGEYAAAFEDMPPHVLKRTALGEADTPAGAEAFRIPYYALGRHGLARLLLPSERTQMPSLRFAIEHIRFVQADENGARITGYHENVLFDDCRQGDAQEAHRQIERIRSGTARVADQWPHMRGLSCLAADWYAINSETRGGVTSYKRNAFNYGHVHSLINRIRGLIEDERFRAVVDVSGGAGLGGALSMSNESQALVERIFGPREFADGSWNIHIIDLSRLTQDLMPFVLGALLELYAAELFRRGPGSTHPTLLALEEAHHYLRQLPGDAESGQHVLAYERLAKEGRKFGLSLMISTQRPSEVSPTVLAQCGTWAVFRLSNDSDQRSVAAAAEAVATNVAKQIAGLARGEAILFGAAMPVATRLSVIRADPQPSSFDPPFVREWRYAGRPKRQGKLAAAGAQRETG